MLPGDRLACLLIDPLKTGDRFLHWPLHVTIVAWFRLDDSSEQLGRGFARALRPVRPFTVRAGYEAHFGPRGRLVRLLETSPELTEVEQKVRAYLHKKRAWLVDETTKRHYDFRPHVTAQAGRRLPSGAIVECDRLYIVEQKGDYRQPDLPEISADSLASANPAGNGSAGSHTPLDSFVRHGNYKEIVSEVCFGKTTA